MGLLSRAGRALRGGLSRAKWEVGESATPAILGGALGALSAGMSGADMEGVGRGALYGAGAGVGLRAISVLPGAAKLLTIPAVAAPPVAGALAVRGDVDAAARKILAFSDGDPERMERVADILYGDEHQAGELYRGNRGRSQSVYGIGASDQAGTGLSGTERDAALQRAYEMIQQGQ